MFALLHGMPGLLLSSISLISAFSSPRQIKSESVSPLSHPLSLYSIKDETEEEGKDDNAAGLWALATVRGGNFRGPLNH